MSRGYTQQRSDRGGGGGYGPPDIEGMTSLKVDNLTYRTGTESLKREFERFGEVGDVYIPRDRHTHESRGFAFVRFYDKRDAEEAMDTMDGRKLDGREMRVQMARYGRPDEPYSRGGGGGRQRERSGRRYSRSRSKSRSPRRERQSRYRSRSRSDSRSRSRSRSRDNKASRSRSRSVDRNGADVSD